MRCYIVIINSTISNNPIIPSIGYNKLTSNEKLTCDRNIPKKHIKRRLFLNDFSFLLQLFKKPQPADIAVVNIDIPIIIMYEYLYKLPWFFTISIIGISKVNIWLLPCNNRLKIAKLNIISNKQVNIDIRKLLFLFLTKFFNGINTGINIMQL